MNRKIKNKELRERQAYVPASVKVINVTAQQIICLSGGKYNKPFGDYEPENL